MWKARSRTCCVPLDRGTCGFYMAMVLTNWAKQPKDNNWDQSEDLNVSDESGWIKLASVCLLLTL